jgi:phosphate transport system permease protein
MSDGRDDTPNEVTLNDDRVRRHLKKRHAAERRFRVYCLLAVGVGIGFLGFLFGDIFHKGHQAFFQTYLRLDVDLDASVLDPQGTRRPETLAAADYLGRIRDALRKRFPEAGDDRSTRRELYSLVSTGAGFELRDAVLEDPSLVGTTREMWVLADDDVDMLLKGEVSRELPEEVRRLSDRQIAWIDELRSAGDAALRFDTLFFTNGDSREPEQAGILGAVLGSAYAMLVTLLISFPLGVATAIYLEEFAPKNRFTDLIEVNINNLAAVPSIVFGLLGLAVFLNFFGLPRSAPLVGGLVLSLMTLPVIIIASRASIQAVPPSIREAAYGVGATPMQVITHHVLPLALPGMLTGTIIGMARALGETAPLLMIGMVAFIVDLPRSAMDPATALPVQIYQWSDSPERAFVEKTSGAILVLVGFLVLMNGLAVWLRRRWERRW